MKRNVQNVRMMTPVIVFGIALLSGLIALVGIYNFRSERHRLEAETQFRMESLVSEMEGKVSAIEQALVSRSRRGDFPDMTDDEIFESLEDFLGEYGLIANVALDYCKPDLQSRNDSTSVVYFVSRTDGGGFGHDISLIKDNEVNEAELNSYWLAERTGEPVWSKAYNDELYEGTHVFTCYKSCDDPDFTLSADITLEGFLKDVDSLNFHANSKMYIVTREEDVYTMIGPEVIYLGTSDSLQDDLQTELSHSIIVSATCEPLGLRVSNLIPKKEIFPSIFGNILIVLLICIIGINLLAVAIYRIFRKAQNDLEISVREADLKEMDLKKIENDIAIAASLQNRMLSSPGKGVHLVAPSGKVSDIMAQVIPAREVGGDLYEYRMVGDNLVVCVGDVSGKGIPASVIMTMCCTLFHAYVWGTDSPDPAALLDYLNIQLSRQNKELMFVTMWAGVINLKTGRMSYSSAGHNPPVLLSRAGASFLEVPHGVPLGIFEDAIFKTAEYSFGEGDSLVLYTDGITEAENEEKELYGDGRLLEVCGKLISRSPELVSNAVLGSVRKHAAGALQSDDITLLCLTVGGRFAQLQKIEEVSALHTLAEECGGSYRTALALEELSVNAIKYGGASFVSAEYRDGKYMIFDDGSEFDPTSYKAPESAGGDDLQIGGRGIDLVKKISSEFTWKRVNGYNITILKIIE